MIDGNLGDPAIDRTPNRLSGASQLEEDARGGGPGLNVRFQIVLNLKVLTEDGPFALVTCALEQLELMEAVSTESPSSAFSNTSFTLPARSRKTLIHTDDHPRIFLNVL